jgi:hypothetical protein
MTLLQTHEISCLDTFTATEFFRVHPEDGGAESVPETSEGFDILTRLSPEKTLQKYELSTSQKFQLYKSKLHKSHYYILKY